MILKVLHTKCSEPLAQQAKCDRVITCGIGIKSTDQRTVNKAAQTAPFLKREVAATDSMCAQTDISWLQNMKKVLGVSATHWY